MSESQKYEVVIGLETHVQLSTESKLFCSSANQYGSEPNSNVSPICMGLPGSLPVVNRKALDYSMKVGLALNCGINRLVKFDRKNYFYPDCPKAYQITQMDYPTCIEGYLTIPVNDTEFKKIRINRAHLEEDAGKNIHLDDCSIVDYNRTGTPLLEIVTEPDLRSSQEAYDYLQKLKLTISYLNVSDCDMEKGSLRCDANVSIRPVGQKEFGTKAEIKNLNSFKAVKAGIEYEIKRQTECLKSGEKIIQETRLWDEQKLVTASMRSKEGAHDYRYFPEPDLVPFTLEESDVENVRKTLPELPDDKLKRFIKEHALSEYDANILIQDKILAQYFEDCVSNFKDTKKIANWMNGAVLKELNERKITISEINVAPKELATLINKVEDGSISNLAAKDVLRFMIDSGKGAEAIIEEKGLAQVSDDSALETIIDDIIKENEEVANQIREGKDSAIGFMVGQAMKKTQGKANPKKIGELIRRRLLNGS
ncbi:MAG: aspartyl-tRNA(Asn)/glutamyl-tRNA(Gln) amidotransferase subunit B [Lysobacterales bacterium]|jgi:aspartyl-tRNA(Asn)/glutamyl-tRNA(Gln) amidotransferase subunit B